MESSSTIPVPVRVPPVSSTLTLPLARFSLCAPRRPNHPSIARSEFEWALSVVLSRSFDVMDSRRQRRSGPLPGGAGGAEGVPMDDVTRVIVPFADMFNHRPGANSTMEFTKDGKGLRLVTHEAHRRGQEVFISYGRHPNYRLLAQYGFAIPENEDDGVGFPLDVLRKLDSCGGDHGVQPEDQDLLLQNMIEHADSGFQHLHILSQGVSDETIMMVRTLMMNASEASDSKAFKRVKLNKHVSVRNEMATLRCLYNMGSCLMYRHHYAPTTLAAQAAQTAQAVGGAGGEAERGGAEGRGRRQAARVTLEGSRKLLLGFMNMMSETVARTQQWTGKNMEHDASVSHVCAHA